MKTRLAPLLFLGLLIFSCSPKVVVQPSAPATESLPTVSTEPAPVKTTTEEAVAHGKMLYDNSCVSCHKRFSPTDFSKTEWVPIMKRMQKKARLDDAQTAMIFDYINSEAK